VHFGSGTILFTLKRDSGKSIARLRLEFERTGVDRVTTILKNDDFEPLKSKLCSKTPKGFEESRIFGFGAHYDNAQSQRGTHPKEQ